MADWRTLRQTLRGLEGRSYGDYKRLKGRYEFFSFNYEFKLFIDYVQGDPFAMPSRIRIRLELEAAGFLAEQINHYENRVAIADYLNRQVVKVASKLSKKRGSGRSGRIEIAVPSQAILRRSAVWIDERGLEVRLTAGLPALGRRIAGQAAAELLCEDIPQIVAQCLNYRALDAAALTRHIHTFQDAEALRRQLAPNGLVAFLAEGACLPRRSGIDERPLAEDVEPFIAPKETVIELETPHSGKVRGLGIKNGITLIVGGGYHGKSTLLQAIQQGIYSHLPGDGRERVVSLAGAVKLRAEDGRSITSVDISPVIGRLPKGRRSDDFSTANASGSTSQAAGLIEAIEAGAEAILMDEDTTATNFMIRDRNMQALIAKDKEPITPFVDKVRQLYDDYGISTILVMGGSGDYFSVADTVIAMEDYQPRVVTREAKAIAQANPNQRRAEGTQQFGAITQRAVLPSSIPADKKDRASKIKAPKIKAPKIKARLNTLTLGHEEIDLRAVEQIAEAHQVRAIAQAILYAQHYYLNGRRSLADTLDIVMKDIQRGGLDWLTIGLDVDNSSVGSSSVDNPSVHNPSVHNSSVDNSSVGNSSVGNSQVSGDLAEFRRFELAAAINRLRTLQINPIH